MRPSVLLAAVLTVVGAMACASGGAASGSATSGEVNTPRLQGVIQPRGGPLSGEVTIAPTARAGEFGVTMTLRGSRAGQQHPWHVHRGRCASEGPIVGSMLAYPVLAMRGDGNIDVRETIRVGLEPGQSYYLDVHASRANMDLILACADLQPAGQESGQ